MHKTTIIKIVVVLLVALSVGAVFLYKKSQTHVADAAVPVSSEQKSGTLPVAPANPIKDSGGLLVREPIDFAALRASGLPVIIDFGADSCIPCKEMAPVLEELYRVLQGKAIIRFVDVWKYRDLANGIPLRVIPTQVFFTAEGKPFTPPASLSSLQFTMYSRKDTGEHVFTTHEGGLTKDEMLAILKAMGMQ